MQDGSTVGTEAQRSIFEVDASQSWLMSDKATTDHRLKDFFGC
jgi:hypothetical protein